ncbi:MAG: amidase [Betaproteobacteria bacterium]|nr:amidase [Betaproteobacteria bacterium]
MDDWGYRTATAMARGIRERRVACVELLDLHLERVRRYNPSLNAIVVLDADRARVRAREADAAIARGESWGPLHGVPMTVKEAFDVAGLPTTWGVPALRDNIAPANATSVDSLLGAGAIIFGKTNVPLLLGDWQTFNAIHGTTNNPWDATRTPGGSSGGSAAALAAGMSALELGSDIGSSVRNPAHYCGVYGHKPSFGVVPQHGHWIPGAHVPLDVLVLGPLARSAEDLALALDLIAGPEPWDRPAWTLKLPEPRRKTLAEFRIALVLDDPNCAVDREVTDRIQAVADAAARAGARVDDKARPRIDTLHAHDLYLKLLRGATGALLSDDGFAQSRANAAQLSPEDRSYGARVLRAVVQDHRAWFAAHEERQAIRAAWAAFFEDYDVVLCPIGATAAFPHDQKRERPDRRIMVNGREEDYNAQLYWAGVASLPNLPGTAAPAGRTPGGLPVGVQIVGPYLQDHTTIECARLLAQVTEGFVPPPGYC